jgi:hypothetical protein
VRPSSWTAFALIATVVVVGSVMAVIWLIHSSKHPVDTGTVYAGYLAAAAIAVTLLMAIDRWWWKGRSAHERAVAGVEILGEVVAGRALCLFDEFGDVVQLQVAEAACGWGEIFGGR